MKSFRTAFEGARKRARVDHFTFHDLRHSFASNLALQGVDPITIRELCGHKSAQMLIRYSHATLDHKRKAVQKLSDLDGHSLVTNISSIEEELA